jgi:hypothetical protein
MAVGIQICDFSIFFSPGTWDVYWSLQESWVNFTAPLG